MLHHCGRKQGAHNSGRYVYYKCTHAKDRNCPQDRFREEEIDQMFAEAMGNLYIDRAIADKIRAGLKESHTEQEASNKKELQRLQSELTRKTNHLELVYQDWLDGTVSKEQYFARQAEIQRELRGIQADIEKMGLINTRYKDEGSTILDLLADFKETYMAADFEGKSRILGAVVDRAVLRGGDLHVSWKQPFDTLFTLGEGVRRNGMWRA